jgi:hypothetical protein
VIHLILFEVGENNHVYVAAERIISVSPLADVRAGQVYAVRGSEILIEGAPALLTVPQKPDEVAEIIAEALSRDTVYPTGDPEGGGL